MDKIILIAVLFIEIRQTFLANGPTDTQQIRKFNKCSVNSFVNNQFKSKSKRVYRMKKLARFLIFILSTRRLILQLTIDL